jgi:hypothetical protein
MKVECPRRNCFFIERCSHAMPHKHRENCDFTVENSKLPKKFLAVHGCPLCKEIK